MSIVSNGMRSTIPLLVKDISLAEVMTTNNDGDPTLRTSAVSTVDLTALGETTDPSSASTVIGLLKSIKATLTV